MNSIQQVVYYLTIILVIFMLGFSLLLFFKKKIEKSWMTEAFGIGTAVLILVSFWISFLGAGLGGCGKIILLFVVVFFMISCFMHKKKCLLFFHELEYTDVCALLICLGAGVVPLLIFICYGALFPYIDGYTYLCNADYFLENGYREIVDKDTMIYHPWLSQTYLYQTNHLRVGAQMLLSCVSGMVGVDMSIKMYLPILGYGVFLFGVSAYGFGRESKKFTGKESLFICLFSAFNVPIIFWIAAYGFLPQLFGCSFFMLAVSRYYGIKVWQEEKCWLIGTAMLFIGTLMLVYSEMFPFFVLVAGMVFVTILFQAKDKIWQLIVNSLLCAIGTIVLVLPYFPGMIKAILTQLGAVVGWDPHKDLLTYILYFLSAITPDGTWDKVWEKQDIVCVLAIIIFIVSVILIIVGGYNVVVRMKERQMLIEMLIINFPFILMLLYYTFFVDNPFGEGKGNPWSIFKLIQYMFIMLVPYIGYYIANGLKMLNKKIVIVYIMLFVGFNINNAINYQEDLSRHMIAFTGENENSLGEYFALKDAYEDYEGIIYLSNDLNIKHRQMITYFLKTNSLLSDWKTDNYFSSIMPIEDYEPADIYLGYDSGEGTIANIKEMNYGLKFDSGFYDEEKDEHNSWMWCQKKAAISVEKVLEKVENEVVLSFDVWPSNGEGNRLNIICNGEKCYEIVLSTEGMTHVEIPICFTDNIFNLEILYEGQIEAGNFADNRELAWRSTNWQIF